jgi:hypothetical protein
MVGTPVADLLSNESSVRLGAAPAALVGLVGLSSRLSDSKRRPAHYEEAVHSFAPTNCNRSTPGNHHLSHHRNFILQHRRGFRIDLMVLAGSIGEGRRPAGRRRSSGPANRSHQLDCCAGRGPARAGRRRDRGDRPSTTRHRGPAARGRVLARMRPGHPGRDGLRLRRHQAGVRAGRPARAGDRPAPLGPGHAAPGSRTRSRHGPVFALADPASWPATDHATSTATTRYGTATATAWHRPHPRLTRRGPWLDHDGELPIIEAPRSDRGSITCPATGNPNRSGCGRPTQPPPPPSRPRLAGVPAPVRHRAHLPVPQAAPGWTSPKIRDPRPPAAGPG